MKLNHIQFTVSSSSPWQRWLHCKLACACVFASRWTCLLCHACPSSFTSLFHYTFTALFRQNPDNPHQLQQMTTPQPSCRAAPHACVNTDLTSNDTILICAGKVSPVPLRTLFMPFRWSGCMHEKATEFLESVSLLQWLNKTKQLLQQQAGWGKSNERVSEIKRHGTFHSWD